MSEPKDINYEPLLALNGVWWLSLRSTARAWGSILIIIFVALSLLVSPFLGFDVAAGIGVLYCVVVSTRVTRLKNAAWWQFATANGWFLDTETPLGTVTPPSLQFGHSQVYSPIIQAQLGNLTCDLLTYRCTTGYGRNEQTHNFTIACLALPQTLPHMLLLSKKAHIDAQRDLENAETLQLEGDFNDSFSLQIDKGQEVNALVFITPDVMQTLVDYNTNEDIEILGTNLYFIVNKDERNYRDMQVIVKSVTELGQRIVQNTKIATPAAV